ncbi:MAG: hypothetical protein IT565_14570, partial [Rhodospirillales bacterium]|nr:hypothetical protein [Rhodospirillales bacterium]
NVPHHARTGQDDRLDNTADFRFENIGIQEPPHNSEEGMYDDEAKFIELVGMLGLQVVARTGDEYTGQSHMLGAPQMIISKADLIKQIESKGDPVPPRLEEMVNEYDDALLMTPEKLQERFVQPMEEERNNFVGPQIPNDLRYERGRIEGLTEKEEAYDFFQIPIRQRTSPALAHEVQKAKEKVRAMESNFYDTRFETQFGISKEDLESIVGFKELSKEQQKLVYENFAQCVLGDIKQEAERLTASVPSERKEEVTGKIRQKFKSFVTGFRDSVTSTSRNIQNEKDVLASMRSGGFAMHGDFIAKLVKNVREFGPRRVHETEKGELVVDLVNLEGRATGKHRGEEWRAMRELNIAAHEFAGIPPGWRGQNLGTESEWKFVRFLRKNVLRSDNLLHEAKYNEAEEKYKNARTEFETTLRNRGMSEFEIKEVLFGIDARMIQLQAYHASPDAIAELEQIEDKSVIKEYGSNFLKNAGPYMALGFVVRSATVASLSLLGPA